MFRRNQHPDAHDGVIAIVTAAKSEGRCCGEGSLIDVQNYDFDPALDRRVCFIRNWYEHGDGSDESRIHQPCNISRQVA